jgi:hypothetical protein
VAALAKVRKYSRSNSNTNGSINKVMEHQKTQVLWCRNCNDSKTELSLHTRVRGRCTRACGVRAPESIPRLHVRAYAWTDRRARDVTSAHRRPRAGQFLSSPSFLFVLLVHLTRLRLRSIDRSLSPLRRNPKQDSYVAFSSTVRTSLLPLLSSTCS